MGIPDQFLFSSVICIQLVGMVKAGCVRWDVKPVLLVVLVVYCMRLSLFHVVSGVTVCHVTCSF